MGLGPVLVEFEFALQIGNPQFKANNAREHLVRKLFPQGTPLRGVGRFVIRNQGLEQGILGSRLFNQSRQHRAVHGQVIPGGHACQIWVHLGRHIGVRPHKGHQRLGTCLQKTPMRVGLGHMTQQHQTITLLSHMQWQVRHIGQTGVVSADEAGKRMLAHQCQGVLLFCCFELRGEVHAVFVQRFLPTAT